VRGEKNLRKLCPVSALGSSPRAWGKVAAAPPLGREARIIPTCVGKSGEYKNDRGVQTDHPHVRGEKFRAFRFGEQKIGSSPRAWGKAMNIRTPIDLLRIIPTCVGKSARPPGIHRAPADHPHVRGEKVAGLGRYPSTDGSSPRAWGKGRHRPVPAGSNRIIPTCVGKRRTARWIGLISTDHPHVRGEKCPPAWHTPRSSGSSPRAWGKGRAATGCGAWRWIIPTCVGKRPLFAVAHSAPPDHPHVRGEKSRTPPPASRVAGSSPRAWGKGGWR